MRQTTLSILAELLVHKTLESRDLGEIALSRQYMAILLLA
jgi:hypothetical protein